MEIVPFDDVELEVESEGLVDVFGAELLSEESPRLLRTLIKPITAIPASMLLVVELSLTVSSAIAASELSAKAGRAKTPPKDVVNSEKATKLCINLLLMDFLNKKITFLIKEII
ncbi:hypothetical protein [Sporomusa sphaeroides]|uniref:hypothetical protein n=1 Tax=Sporomusa sphaeroides TaxID=47679 RepID=UPI0031591F09